MLKLAVQASLPMVAVTTRDTMNLPDVIAHITGRKPLSWLPASGKAFEPKTLHLYEFDDMGKQMNLDALYHKLVAAESTLLIVNPPKVVEPMFHAGEVPVPRDMMFNFIRQVIQDDAKAGALIQGLGGCTIKEAAEMARLTMARDHSLTSQGLMETRKECFMGGRGLTPVDTEQDYYEPHGGLKDWVETERAFFLHGSDHRLIPRGLLLDGPPGVGKTAASKWLAQQIGVPLYRVDVGGTKNKYVGESEAQMLTNLSRLDNEEPCIALFDEIEKVFTNGGGDSSGTTTTMLSQLLWWLAERKTRVMVVMTTNNAKALPRELYRDGRIDQVLWFNGLTKDLAHEFIHSILDTFDWSDCDKPTNAAVEKAGKDIFASSKIEGTNPAQVPHSALRSAAYDLVKLTKLPVTQRD